MRLFASEQEVPSDFGPSVVVIGKFNSVHIGHVAMINYARELNESRGLISTVVTFDRDPKSLIDPLNAPIDVTGMVRRLSLIESAGADAALVLPFTFELAKLSPEDFVRRIIHDLLHAKVVIVGKDFRFGFKASGDIRTLTQLGEVYGFEVVVLDDLVLENGRRVSSSWVREALNDGDCELVAKLLGRNHAIRGQVVRGFARGRELGFPTANIGKDSTGLIPGDGVYAGFLVDEDGTRYPAAISVGTNPTFEGVKDRVVEAYCLDVTRDFYDHMVVIEFVGKIRSMLTFDNLDELVDQMNRDVTEARAILGLLSL